MMLLRRVFCLLAASVAGAARAGVSPAEQARIDRLIAYVEARKDVTFVRNGKDYTCTEAARFMRGKLRAMGEHVTTVQQFIDQIASKSSTTGQPYMIRFADSRVQPAAQFLGDELQRMDGKY
jgi:Family of unknown function (DUF5329)